MIKKIHIFSLTLFLDKCYIHESKKKRINESKINKGEIGIVIFSIMIVVDFCLYLHHHNFYLLLNVHTKLEGLYILLQNY